MNLNRLSVSIFLALSVPAWAQDTPPAATKSYEALLDGNGRELGLALVRNGNTADNKLGGAVGRDTFNGAAGNDILIGFEDRDTYVFKPGDGLDTIYDTSPEGSVIRFRGSVDPASVEEALVPGWNGETDRLIRYAENDAIRIVGWSRLSATEQAAWSIEFVPPPTPRATDFREVPDRSASTAESTGLLDTFLNALIWGIGVGLVLLLTAKVLVKMRRRT